MLYICFIYSSVCVTFTKKNVKDCKAPRKMRRTWRLFLHCKGVGSLWVLKQTCADPGLCLVTKDGHQVTVDGGWFMNGALTAHLHQTEIDGVPPMPHSQASSTWGKVLHVKSKPFNLEYS